MKPANTKPHHLHLIGRTRRCAVSGLMVAVVAALGACTTTQAADRQARLAAEIKARQGEPVNQICFTRSIDGWKSLGRKSLLLSKGVNEWYKLDLSGTCDPQWAFNAIGIETHPTGALCLSKGDEIKTFNNPGQHETCFITDIYKWNDKAKIPESHSMTKYPENHGKT